MTRVQVIQGYLLTFRFFLKLPGLFYILIYHDVVICTNISLANKMNQNKNDTLSKQFQSLIGKSYNGTKSISLTHLYII